MRRVVIADDSLLLRQGVSAVLATLEGVEVVASGLVGLGLPVEVESAAEQYQREAEQQDRDEQDDEYLHPTGDRTEQRNHSGDGTTD